MKTFAVYRIHNIETNMDYIGWSGDPINRVFRQHERINSYIGNAICVYGWDVFDVDVLHLVKTKEEACRLEIEEIAKHNCQAPNGYNLTSGGDGTEGYEWSKESREKVGKSHRGKKKPYVSKSNRERKGEKKPGVSKALKGRKRPEHSKILKGRKRPDVAARFKGNKNPSCRIEVKIKKLKTRLEKLAKEIGEIE